MKHREFYSALSKACLFSLHARCMHASGSTRTCAQPRQVWRRVLQPVDTHHPAGLPARGDATARVAAPAAATASRTWPLSSLAGLSVRCTCQDAERAAAAGGESSCETKLEAASTASRSLNASARVATETSGPSSGDGSATSGANMTSRSAMPSIALATSGCDGMSCSLNASERHAEPFCSAYATPGYAGMQLRPSWLSPLRIECKNPTASAHRSAADAGRESHVGSPA
jgi:hypothetical protein